MKKFTSVLIVSCGLVLLGGCSLSSSQQQDLFTKKQECGKNMNFIETREKKNREYESDAESSYANVLGIFYSPQLNTCIFYGYTRTHYTDKSARFTEYYIKDALTYERVRSADELQTDKQLAQDIMNNKVKELKGE